MRKSVKFDGARIERVLRGEAPTTTLNDEEKTIWSEQFRTALGEPGPKEAVFFGKLRASGKAVGLDADGNIAKAKPLA
ncbi:hypothetical protein U879_10845 [Defluviimonas sp. 20V17]|uniref:Uncharacterized protein n=1 Tax=Allgaiera indica TaxID=765699 RepID=A0AAN4UNH1_9RHOB|nr:hypothetical protein [Allgaiera indica]KDB03664.1 hypothetical protein U879_10845 [Defluviimonas sp. 20V17]GHD98474.1 hypothetical protein GCM10008024_02130 [Allgaiera indica]SDW46865.1 hypothetical protein SAMN05444006_1042 [Allgaiera indica]